MDHSEAEQRLRSVLDAVVDTVVTIDHAGIIEDVNPATERLFGYTRAELVGSNVKILMPEPDASAHDAYIRNYLTTGTPRIIGIGREVTARHKDGTQFPVDLSVSEMSAGTAPKFIGVIRDLSSRKQIELELAHIRRLESLGQLTGGIAHDFNNLLTVIMGNLEMLEGVVQTDECRELVAEATEATALGASLTSRLLAFARRQTLAPRDLDLNDLVETVLVLLRRTLGQKIAIEADLSPTVWPIRADPGEIENTLLNLAINARDAMPDGGALTISTANQTLSAHQLSDDRDIAPGDYVRLAIADTGTGMPAEVAGRAIEPFFTTKLTGSGTGLGLSSAYGFVKQSGGDLSIHSEPGAGTRIDMLFPRSAGTAPTDQPIDSAPAAGSGETVLLVEDDPRVRRVTAQRLRGLGYAVVEAANGEQALLKLAEDGAIDLLFSDLVMPGMSGDELVDRARRDRPDLPVLLTTGYAGSARQVTENSAPLLPKPYSTAALQSALRAILD